MKHTEKHSKPKSILLLLSILLILTACQKTTQFTYEAGGDYLKEASTVMDGLGQFNPQVEKIVVMAAVFNENGIGMLQEHQLYDFSSITINTVPGGKIVLSVPDDPQDSFHWRLVLNESKTSSKIYLPTVVDKKANQVYDRLNYLLEPDFDTDITFVLEDDTGHRKMTFLTSIRGITD